MFCCFCASNLGAQRVVSTAGAMALLVPSRPTWVLCWVQKHFALLQHTCGQINGNCYILRCHNTEQAMSWQAPSLLLPQATCSKKLATDEYADFSVFLFSRSAYLLFCRHCFCAEPEDPAEVLQLLVLSSRNLLQPRILKSLTWIVQAD